jgi:hypothetical protein
MLFPNPIMRMLEQVGPQFRLFSLQSLDLKPDISQAIRRVTVLHERPPKQ